MTTMRNAPYFADLIGRTYIMEFESDLQTKIAQDKTMQPANEH